MGILDFMRRDANTGIEVRATSSSLLPPNRSTVSSVNTTEALSLAMVYRAINIHVIASKQMPIHVYRGDIEVPSPSFVAQPDVNNNRSAFIEQAIVSLATNGNCFWEIQRDTAGRVMNLTVLNPNDVAIEANTAGKVTKYLYQDRELKPNTVKHLSLLRVPGQTRGLSPIAAAQKELRGAIDVRDYSASWFSKGGVPNGILKSDQVLSPDQAIAAKNAWNETAGAAQGVAVLGNGITYNPITLSPNDAQFIETQNFTVTQIARLFGVPASLMLAGVDGTSMTYTNIEQDWIAYVRFSLMSYLVEIEAAFTDLLPRGQRAKFNLDSLLRSDTLSRYQAHQIALTAGFMTIDEIRKLENLPPLGVTPNV